VKKENAENFQAQKKWLRSKWGGTISLKRAKQYRRQEKGTQAGGGGKPGREEKKLSDSSD